MRSAQWSAHFSIWSVLVGLFLFDAAAGVVRNARNMKQATVMDAMSVPISIEPDVLMSHFVDSILPMHRQTSFPVAHAHRLHGILALEDLKKLPRERWRVTKARDVMRPVSPDFLRAEATMASADEIMQRNGINSVAVVDAPVMIGFLQRGRLRKRRANAQN